MGNQEEEQKVKNLPTHKFRAGGITATVWQNSTKKDGKDIEYRTITLERSYKDKDDKWQTTNSMRINDLPKVAMVCNEAFKVLVLKTE